MFCNNCGAQIDDETKFCNKCGATQNSVSKPQNSNSNSNAMNIPSYNAGTANNSNGIYNGKCLKCGYQGEMIPGPYLRVREIIVIVFSVLSLIGIIPAGFLLVPIFAIYLIVVLIVRIKPDKRERICQRCNSKKISFK